MKYHFILSLLFFSFSLFPTGAGAQQPVPSGKSVSPINHPTIKPSSHQTYAVVVGISDYQDEDIPDLRFADKDALAFAGFLQSLAGGSLDEDHLKVLINEQATAAQFAIALDWLWEVATENDRVIIYFSGHGDVEKKSISQPGYLLCWDAPSQIYMAGGAFNVRDLNDVVSTLSIQNKAKVILVTDACRAGKLSGSGIGGTQATATNLAKQYANEIKILSCQPDEYSIEGEQWGGGRGAFSYHLLDGLLGMADRNTDQSVNLMEIRGYLEEHVSAEVAPQNQLPMVVGNGREKLTDVFPEILALLKEGKKGQMQLFTAIDPRGIEEDVLAAADSNVVEMYLAFQKSIEEKRFLTPENASADFYYEKLSSEPQLAKLHSSMRRNYAAALQDDAQQVLNKLLKSDPWEVNKSLYKKKKNYGHYPALLRRAADLLGKEHYMHDILMARSYWFEGYVKDDSYCACLNIPNARKIIPYYKKALQFQPDMPHAHLQLSAVYGVQMHVPDSAEYYADLALKSVPNWTAAYDWVANSYLNIANNWQVSQSQKEQYMDKAKEWLERGITADSNSIILLNDLGYWYSLKGDFTKEQAAYDRALAIDTTATTLEYKAIGYYWWGKFKEAEKAWLETFKIKPGNVSQSNIFEMYYLTGEDEKAKKLLREILATDHKEAGYYKKPASAINIYYPEEAIELFKKSLTKGPLDAMGYNSFAHCFAYLQPKDFKKYLKYKKKAVELDPENHLYHNNIGLYHLSQQEWTKAEEKFLYARSLNRTHPRTNAALYLLYTLLGHTDQAEKELVAGMELSAREMLSKISGMAAYAIAESMDEGQFFHAIEKAYPDDPLVHYYYAQYLSFAKKDTAGGFVQLEKALQNGYDSFHFIMINTMFRNLQADKDKWTSLVNRYFPAQYKTSDQ